MATELQKLGNPQGKGVVGVVDDLQAYMPLQVQAKSSHQWLADYFTSTVVLSAKYGFKPIMGKDYFLYFKNNEWKLSLIEPHAWTSHKSGIYFAKCILHKDMSWSLEPKEDWQKSALLANTICKLESAFVETINNQTPLIEQLPFFVKQLPYYQRLGANALARSLKQSLEFKLGKKESLQLSGKSIIADLADSSTPLLGFTP